MMTLARPHPEEIRERILELKRTPNAAGEPHSYREIAKLLGISAQGVYYYTRDLTGVCPCCLRKMEKQPKE